MVELTDGTSQELSQLSVRATEYTVGEDGEKRMPAELPPNSAYTYAVELTLDEAEALGATGVTFSEPVIYHLENFLQFPTGTAVPAGYYDEARGVWVPAANGLVIEILSETDGLADLDLDGSGTIADATALSDLGVTDSERTQLATHYEPGTSLWRIPLSHFSAWDFNWPFAFPEDAAAPQLSDTSQKSFLDQPLEDSCLQTGSRIECENQTLGESVPLAGTPLSLHYTSDRVSGNADVFSVTFPVSDASLPTSLKRVDLDLFIAGRHEEDFVEAAADQTYTYTWDGLDAYGRVVQGSENLKVVVSYVYDAAYVPSLPEFTQGFGATGDADIIIRDFSRKEVKLSRELNYSMGTLDQRSTGLGGWSLSVHHVYDPSSKILYLGDGTRHSAQAVEKIISSVAGTGTSGFSGDGDDAEEAQIAHPYDVAVDRDGNIFIADYTNNRIRKIDVTTGIISTYAGTGSSGYSGEDGPATSARIYHPQGICTDKDGNLYIADYTYHRVVKVTTDGTLTRVAGTTASYGFSGDNGPATSALLLQPIDVAADDYGNIYILDAGNKRIRKVDPSGTITTIAGNGNNPSGGVFGEGDKALDAPIGDSVMGIEVDSKGNVYFTYYATNGFVRKIGVDGILTRVAGVNNWDPDYGDGAQATEAQVAAPRDIAIDKAGNIYISEDYKIRKVAPDGVISTFAGTGGYTELGGVGSPATNIRINYTRGITVDNNGDLIYAESSYYRVRKVTSPFPSFTGDSILISSEDGTLLYQFDSNGRHLSTVHAQTGETLYAFTYDDSGYLIQIEDGNGLITTIARNGASPEVFVAPFGQETSFTLDANGYLATITNPANEVFQIDYDEEGLLTSFTNPNNHTTSYTYNDEGKLTGTSDAAGGSKILSRTENAEGYEVSIQTGMGRTNIYTVTTLTDGYQRSQTNPANLTTTTTIATDGTKTTTTPDGTLIIHEEGPDPRFGMMAPFVEATILTTPAGLNYTEEIAKSVTLTDSEDWLTLETASSLATINDRIYTSAYDASTRDFILTSPENRQWLATLDGQGRITSEITAGLDEVSYTYDASGRLETIQEATDGSRSYNFTYDTEGFLATMTDPLSRQTTFDYDAVGRVTTQTLPDARQITYTYDANGNLETLTPPGKPAHSFGYNAVDLQTSYTPPDIALANHQTQYSYNLDKQLDLITRPDFQTIDFEYDTGGRLYTLSFSRGTFLYDYDETTGHLETITTPEGNTLAYLYDGFLPTTTTWSGSISGSVTRAYDDNFWITSFTINGADTVALIYDNDGLLTNAGDLTLTRDSNHGLITTTTLSSVTTATDYNDFGELETEDTSYSGTSYSAVTYTRDNLGRIETKSETVLGEAHTYAYTYDTAGRLDTVTVDGSLTNDYGYDDNGNKTSPTSATYDDQDRLTTYGSNVYTYTDNGELLTKVNGDGTTTYTYDSLGNLTTVVLPSSDTIEYIIDGVNRRIGKKYNGTLMNGYLYSVIASEAQAERGNPGLSQLIAELNGDDGHVVSRFIYGSKANVPDYMIKEGTTYRIISDHLGSVRLVVDTSDGSIDQQIIYDEFGNVTSDTSPGFQPFGFAGGLYDSDTGLVRFGARDYDAEIGRWTTKDPILFNGGDTNLYGYVLSDPVNLIDPLGLYGTQECGYYGERCQESGGDYYCAVAPWFCKTFPRPGDPDPSRSSDYEGFPRCARQCLQDCDANQNKNQNQCPSEPNESTDSFFDKGPMSCHTECYNECLLHRRNPRYAN